MSEALTEFNLRVLRVIGVDGVTSFIPPSQMPARMHVCDMGLCEARTLWRDGRQQWDWKLTEAGRAALGLR